MKKGTKGLLAFLAVCGMGLFAAVAGGVEWSTPDAGIIAAFTFGCGIIAAAAVNT